jgi:hypothetical protein
LKEYTIGTVVILVAFKPGFLLVYSIPDFGAKPHVNDDTEKASFSVKIQIHNENM